MGRIAKELERARKSKAARVASTEDRETKSATIKSVDDDFEDLNFDGLRNVIPDDQCLVENRIVAAQDETPERAVYKVLRTRMLQRLRASSSNIVGITGTGPGEGKTVTALNLAFSLAQDVNHRILLIDLDLRRPSVHHYLGIEPEHDLSDFLEGSMSLQEILVRPDEKRLAVMTNQTAFRDSSEILSSPKISELIHYLKNLGPKTITILDLPPVLAGDDVIAISPLIDAFMLVVAQGVCKREHLAEAHELIRDSNILGVVLNRSRDKLSSRGYYDYYQ
jgi:capsular exopolysaccharide synthesis family protein